MRHSKHVLRAFGLSLLAALSLMAVIAAGAQAENLAGTAGVFKILGTTVEGAAEETATGETVENSVLIVLGLNTEIKCTAIDVTEGKIKASGDANVIILFLGCEAYAISTGELLANCKTVGPEPEKLSGDIKVEALVLVLLHNSVTYIKAEPKTGATRFARIKFEAGCSLTNPIDVTGSAIFNVTQTEVKEPVLSNPGDTTAGKELQSLLQAALSYGVNEAFVKGTAKVKLTGAKTGCTWGAV